MYTCIHIIYIYKHINSHDSFQIVWSMNGSQHAVHIYVDVYGKNAIYHIVWSMNIFLITTCGSYVDVWGKWPSLTNRSILFYIFWFLQ